MCGGEFGARGVTKVKPGLLTLAFEESVWHRGAPFRVALSNEGGDGGFDECILLDHIPHMDAYSPHPSLNDESSWPMFYISVPIPDVKCAKCSLQLLNIMTDKSKGGCGIDKCVYKPENAQCRPNEEEVPNDKKKTCSTWTTNFDLPNCTEPNSCFSNYHSCIDLEIQGTQSMLEYQCSQPPDWPFSNLTPSTYGQESTVWEEIPSSDGDARFVLPAKIKSSFQNYVPDKYRSVETALCEEPPSPPPSSPPSSRPPSAATKVLAVLTLLALLGLGFFFRKTMWEGCKPWVSSVPGLKRFFPKGSTGRTDIQFQPL